MHDGATGERLLTSDELELQTEQERQRADQAEAELQQLRDRLRDLGVDPTTLQ